MSFATATPTPRSQNLGNTQVATRAVAWGTGTVTLKYEHTDALGSPVAETDATGVAVKRNSYAPYGEAYAPTVIDGAGYTGHVMDQATGLTYMQQRYYDPQVGRFLSVDPMGVDTTSAFNFNRFNYAADNPYRFTDPDGRSPFPAGVTREINQAFHDQAAQVSATVREYAPRVAEGVMGIVDVGLGIVEIGVGGAAAAAGGAGTVGVGAIPGVLVMGKGGLTAANGVSAIRNAVDGVERHSVEGQAIQALGGGEAGAQVGDVVSAAGSVRSAGHAVGEVVEHATVRTVTHAAAEAASSGKSISEALKRKRQEGSGE